MSSSNSSTSSVCSDAAFKPSQSPSYQFVPPPHPSANLRTLLKYIDALNRLDHDTVLDCFDSTLEHRILPKSIGRPVLNKKQYGDYYRSIVAFFKELHVAVYEVIEAGDKITVHGTTTGESITGTPYKNEFVNIMHFTPPAATGETKISIVKEFVDGTATVKFFTDERAKAKAKAEAEMKLAKARKAEARAQARAAAFSSR